jgi:hypothetical protein
MVTIEFIRSGLPSLIPYDLQISDGPGLMVTVPGNFVA